MSKPVRLELTGDEALVLYDFLERFDEQARSGTIDPAEQTALWRLACQLEKQLVEVVDPAYQALVAAARDRLRSPDE